MEAIVGVGVFLLGLWLGWTGGRAEERHIERMRYAHERRRAPPSPASPGGADDADGGSNG